MMGIGGLGSKPIKVSLAIQKGKEMQGVSSYIPSSLAPTPSLPPTPSQAPAPASTDYSAYYEQYSQYWSQYAAWSQYNQQYGGYYNQQDPQGEMDQNKSKPTPPLPPPAETQPNLSTTEGDMYELVQHSVKVDVDSLNAKYLDQQQGLWEAMERSRWWGDIQAF